MNSLKCFWCEKNKRAMALWTSVQQGQCICEQVITPWPIDLFGWLVKVLAYGPRDDEFLSSFDAYHFVTMSFWPLNASILSSFSGLMTSDGLRGHHTASEDLRYDCSGLCLAYEWYFSQNVPPLRSTSSPSNLARASFWGAKHYVHARKNQNSSKT